MKNQFQRRHNEITDAEALIKKYEEQQKNVRNNREFDSLSKEIEYQNLEIELYNKKIKEFNFQIEEKKVVIAESEATLSDRKTISKIKNQSLMRSFPIPRKRKRVFIRNLKRSGYY